ncbi:universal stress protein [Oryzomonas japonica]|uniref:Universal stress protein n=1 Tax=Oryzomonas japonica TaxID=2603858 RepID=A0A7J4ZLQ8_9BACT|nr:universal stress protein [Oryzomonas japonica]KAB0663409.1 universal stress protein [Oryzomonas japonica]
MKNIDTILFATDFSGISDYAFDYAASLAAVCDARLVIVHVVTHQVDLRDFYVPHISFDEIDKEVEAGAQKRMVEFCEKRMGPFPGTKSFVVTGIPHEEIFKKAVEEKASLIVMGTHGRQGVEHFIFGSTAERVVKTAPCPVLTVRPPQQPDQG